MSFFWMMPFYAVLAGLARLAAPAGLAPAGLAPAGLASAGLAPHLFFLADVAPDPGYTFIFEFGTLIAFGFAVTLVIAGIIVAIVLIVRNARK